MERQHPSHWPRAWARLVARVLAVKGTRCKLALPGVCTGVATTADHTTPVALGGSDDLSNLEPACKPCNQSKSKRVLKTDASQASESW